MSLHKLTAGSGYDYLTRQVAALDATEKGHAGLASYYTERGETPGVWVGSGCAAIRPGFTGSIVTQEQMQALFGAGLNPVGAELVRQIGPDASPELQDAALRLGAPFRLKDGASAFRVEVARRIAELNASRGLARDAVISLDDRARIRTAVAREVFTQEFGRPPTNARELAGTIARHSRPAGTAVAGFDLTFSPPKSVSTLWAVADRQTAGRIEKAHLDAVLVALRFVEQNLLYSREGTRGVRQVDVEGLVAASFTHRDTRAGDPDLHTHVAVANKVRTRGTGKWLSIDGRVLYQGAVAASETYNTALVKLLERQGLHFEDRPSPDGRRPVREIAGVSAELNRRWSSRRADIETRREQLAADFQRNHGRPPTVVESVKLAQQATLETRDAKHEPRSLAEQRAVWHAQAVEVLGGEGELRSMIERAVGKRATTLERADAAWFERSADHIITTMEARAATWQDSHLRAEAQRCVRRTDVRLEQVPAAVDLLVTMATDRSVSLARPDLGIVEPAQLRRADGSSVYTVAGAELFTSTRILAAERHLVTLAGQHGGRQVAPERIAAALQIADDEGHPLNPGQTNLVTQMATSGARLQLAIAPAGAGKTTAMQALAAAWTSDGGDVIGLAPSAAAAAQLANQTGTTTETLAKLTWAIDHHQLPGWAAAIGPTTLLIIDEAGMADTPNLTKACTWAIDRGASVRLIGDNQQLSAIGAGGVLRDIAASHGAVRLSELMRFTDPAEAAASLALRDGDTAALGFYLDSGRVHVGDLTTMTDHAFTAWQDDIAAGHDSILLAPTRSLVRDLNERARDARLAEPGNPAGGRQAVLGDGLFGSTGDTVITRTNDRRLRISRSDWVKNGDRWTILDVTARGDLRVQHRGTGHHVTLPADYVTDSVELGYACTVHSAQGVSVDTMHGVVTGQESRQQFYTMMTRGRLANHAWLEVVSDGSDASLIRPEGVNPLTPTDVLEQILGRDQAQASATTLLREQADPRLLLGDATQRYLDGLGVAAEHHLGREQVAALDSRADTLLPGLRDEAAWPTLRAHLLLLGAHGDNPVRHLEDALDLREIAGAHDMAAVLSWRLDPTGFRNATPGPLPWLPGVPATLSEDATFGPWLTRRAALVSQLAADVRDATDARDHDPGWVPSGGRRPSEDLIVDIEVWRAAMQVDPADTRATGPLQLSRTALDHQRDLSVRVRGGHAPAMAEWGDLLHRLDPAIGRDPYIHPLADHLAALSRAGIDAATLVRTAANVGSLPDDHAAAALWWRITGTLTQQALEQAQRPRAPGAWIDQLADVVGPEHAQVLSSSPFWPTLVDHVDHALERGWSLPALIHTSGTSDIDPCLAMVCQVAAWTSGPPALAEEPGESPAATDDGSSWDVGEPAGVVTAPDERWGSEPDDVETQLAIAALVRQSLGEPELTDADVRRMMQRADAWDDCPIPRERLVAINQMSQDYFASRFPGSWGQAYLISRFRADLTGHPLAQPGQARAGWTNLVTHLRARGVSDDEMLTAGVARVASTGRLIDQFRDRIVFPIIDQGEILGFVGRRNPAHDNDDKAGPKYLNTGETPLYRKGDQFYGTLRDHTIPVIVEGPMDAIAVTLGTLGRYSGLAPLGTSLTEQQARLLYGQPTVIIATDADPAGNTAAERDYWHLTPYGIDPLRARFADGTDPSSLLTSQGPDALAATFAQSEPMARLMIDERVANLPVPHALDEAVRITAARPTDRWDADSWHIADQLLLPVDEVRSRLVPRVQSWNRAPRDAARDARLHDTEVRRRIQALGKLTRWARLAMQVDPRLTRQPDWPALEAVMQRAHDVGQDVEEAVQLLASPDQPSGAPATQLRARLNVSLGVLNAMPSEATVRPPAASLTPQRLVGGRSPFNR